MSSDPLLQSGSTNFGEKFSRVKFSPSLTLFGGKPMEGWLAVTVSGLVTVSLLKPGGALLTASESLCRLRGRVALADIAFTGGGNIVVAASDGSSSSPVQFYKVRPVPEQSCTGPSAALMAAVCPGGGERGEREMPHRHRAAALSVPALHHRPPEERQVPRRDPPQVPHQREL